MSDAIKHTKAMIGYGIWVVLEDELRNWLADRLINVFGERWPEQFPPGIWNELHTVYNQTIKPSNLEQVRELLEHSNFPDLVDIVRFRKQKHVNEFLTIASVEDLDYYSQKLYSLRNQIAHKPYSFTLRSLNDPNGTRTRLCTLPKVRWAVLHETSILESSYSKCA